MHRLLLLAALSTAALSAAQPPDRAPRRQIDNVAAFTRLYGVVRYFYPGDAAAAFEWDRFAVYGVQQVRAARDARSLESALTSLFSAFGPGITIGTKLPPAPASGASDEALIAWRYLGPGFAGAGQGPFKGARTHRAATDKAIDGFVSLMQTVQAESLRGKTIRLRGRVRASEAGATGAAALWLRVDRVNEAQGFFDNMGDRPIREEAWREYSIEGPVAEDATVVAMGALASGEVAADFDAIALEVRYADGSWAPVPIKDAGFEAADTAEGWHRVGSSRNATITRPAGQAPEGHQFLRLAGPRTAATIAELFAAPAIAGAHVDVALGAGLKARVPLALPEAEAVRLPGELEALRTAVRAVPSAAGRSDVDVRLADVTVAWNVLRHFYPYWPDAGVDWDARLAPQLEIAYLATTRAAHRDALRSLVADARDGHGRVNDTRAAEARAMLPVQFSLIEGSVVVTATGAPDAPIGAVVSAIDGVPAAQRVASEMRLASGTTQWKQARAMSEIAMCATTGTPVALVVDSGSGPRQVSLPCQAKQRPSESRPDTIAELTPGIWYVDLTRATMAQVTPKLSALAEAAGVVFDVRGYPRDAGAQILRHLMDAAEQDRWMHVAKITGPFGQTAGWESFGWDMTPASPRLKGRIVFLTDGRAISYAESVMGYVADRKLATIVGSPTAGTNGNVVTFGVPGGFSVMFTGMRVTRHDGRSPYHLIGVTPDIVVVPTVAGLRAGRDEVLERAVAIIRDRAKS